MIQMMPFVYMQNSINLLKQDNKCNEPFYFLSYKIFLLFIVIQKTIALMGQSYVLFSKDYFFAYRIY